MISLFLVELGERALFGEGLDRPANKIMYSANKLDYSANKSSVDRISPAQYMDLVFGWPLGSVRLMQVLQPPKNLSEEGFYGTDLFYFLFTVWSRFRFIF